MLSRSPRPEGLSADRSCRMVVVELLGPARLLAGRKDVTLPLDGTATLGKILDLLARQCPVLVGPVLDPGLRAVADGYICSLNGRAFVTDPDAPVKPGDRLLLLASAAGG